MKPIDNSMLPGRYRNVPIKMHTEEWGDYHCAKVSREGEPIFILFCHLRDSLVVLLQPLPAITLGELDFYLANLNATRVDDWKLVSDDPIYLAALTVFGLDV